MVNKNPKLPAGLKYTIEIEPDDVTDFNGKPDLLLLTVRIASNNKVIGEYPDMIPDRAISPGELQHRIDYISTLLEADLELFVLKLYNEAKLAVEFEKGIITKKAALQILKRHANLLPKEAKGRMPLPPATRGRPYSLSEEDRDNMRATYIEEYKKFKSAKNVIQVFQEHPRFGDWKEQLRMLGDERLEFARVFSSTKSDHPDPLNAVRQVTLAYMARLFGVSKRTLERVIPAKNQPTE